MKRILSIPLLVLLVAALACGSVEDKQACSVSTDCPVGQYCAHAEGESRCWADTVNPVVATVTASCAPAPCLRDGVLHVEATVTDDAGVLDASVSLDLPGGSPVAMTLVGTTWKADVELRSFGFPAFSQDVIATVTARDGARNPSDPQDASGVAVTRLRWDRSIDTGGAVVTPTSPAVKADGTVVIGGSNGKLYFIAADGSDARAPLVVGAGPISAAPAVGASTIWIGSEDFTLYGVELDGSAVKAGVGVNVGGAVKGCVGVLPGTGKEWAFATSSAGFTGVASTVPNENDLVGPTATYSVGPVVGSDGRIFAGTAALSATVRAYSLNTAAVVLNEQWNAAVGLNVAAPLAIDASGAVWSGTLDGKLNKTVPGETSGTVIPVATLPGAIVDSPVILTSGDVVVGDDTGLLHRYTSTGTQVWTNEPNLGAAVLAPIVLANGDAAFVVPTATGKLFARAADGSDVWSTTLDSGNALRAPNIHTPPGQTTNIMSTVYVASSSGKLFAVVVDGQLDAAAPWPKAFHDPKNTNRAGPQP